MTALGRLLAGEGPPVLQTCRLEGLGGETYGRELVGDALKGARFGAWTLDVETGHMGVWMDDDTAVVADLAEGGVGRIWLLGRTAALVPPPVLDLPVDPDMAQTRHGVRFDPQDHPKLNAAHVERLVAASEDWPDSGVVAPRPVILRAASFGEVAVALIRLEARGPSSPVAFNALLVVRPTGVERRLDEAGRTAALARPWTPRL
jgi:hypothetical protein